MNRILVDLPEEQIQALALIAAQEQRSRASVIRDAIAVYIKRYQPANPDDVFGLWRNRDIDGVQYQEALRSEW